MSSDDRLDVQKKTFGKWINSQLPSASACPRVTDLFFDLRDGCVLLTLLETLTGKAFRREQGQLRVHRLSNVATVLNALRDSQVKLVNINNVDVVDGSPKITLALVWAIILHWQFNKVLGSEIQHVSNLERSLLAWCRQSCAAGQVDVVNFTSSWKDGLAFCAVLHHFFPHLFDLDEIRKKEPLARLDFAFRMIQQQLNLARLLDPEDLQKPDKKSVMTYVMCMFKVLPHDDIDMSVLRDVSGAAVDPGLTDNLIGSPLRMPIKNITKGKLLSYDMFCSIHEDVLEWLLDVEDKLGAMKAVGKELVEVREQYQNNRAFLFEVEAQDGSVGEVHKEGLLLLDSGLPSKEDKDVRVRVKLLLDRWNKFRNMAMDRQNEIDGTLMALQKNELNKIREWMTLTEDKISRMDNIGSSIDEVKRHLERHSELQKEFEIREALISDFINVLPSAAAASSSSANEEIGGGAEQDLEGHLMAIEERWFVLCAWIENRWQTLTKVIDLWQQFDQERRSLTEWLSRVEKVLKLMEQSPTEEANELLLQVQKIIAVQSELGTRQKQIDHLESTAEKLVVYLERELEAKEGVSKDLELIQDKWEILSEVMEAQRQRLTNLGLNIAPSSTQTSPKSAADSIENDETSSKKRKITGTKRIEFETSFARTAPWLQKTVERLEYHTSSESFPSGTSEVEESILLNECHVLLREAEENVDGMCKESVRLGEDLISEIQSEENFPPDYLCNVTEKVRTLQSQLDNIGKKSKILQDRLGYLKCRRKFCKGKEELFVKINSLEDWLYQLDVEKESESLERVENAIASCSEKKATLRTFESDMEELKRRCGEVTLHPGAIEDPSNHVKADVYALCDKWNSIETCFAQKESELVRRKRQLEESADGVNQTDVSMFCSPSSSRTGDRELVHKLQTPLCVESCEVMEEEIASLRAHFVRGDIRDELKRQVEARIRSLESEVCQLRQFESELEGLNRWMTEVDVFLTAEDAAFGDVETLEAQLKESDALQDDISTLKPNVTVMNDAGKRLQKKATSEFAESRIRSRLREVNKHWQETIEASKTQNKKLKMCLDQSRILSSEIEEMSSFLDRLEQDLPNDKPVTLPTEMSQLSYKLLQLKDRIERKTFIFDKLAVKAEEGLASDNRKSGENPFEQKWTILKKRWHSLVEQVDEKLSSIKSASSEYGEFKTMAAQESDWLERLEKKLRKSAITAADAEEISEEHDDIENFLNNHPEERLTKLEELAKILKKRKVSISPFESDAQNLKKRWHELSQKAKKRLSLLEGSIEEAQEWEYKLIEVQDWLSDKDILLTSHLEQELTVDDLPDESQKEKMLREFEDQENLLSEMDEQVDAYRDSGKLEAANRLEDQLLLIHQRFQELLMKFELFQQQPAVEYEPRLDRVQRQLRDIRQKIYLTELASTRTEDIQGQLHHARCIYNALSDIKPEVENVIKMGRKVVDSQAVENTKELTVKIDSLKQDFNVVGAQITDAKKILEKSLHMSEQLQKLLGTVNEWLSCTDSQLTNSHISNEEEKVLIIKKFKEMSKMKEQVKAIQVLHDEFLELGNPVLLTALKETVRAIESRWAKVIDRLQKRVEQLRKVKPAWAKKELADIKFQSFALSPSRELVTSAGQEDAALLAEFKASFREVTAWIDSAESKLTNGKSRLSQDRALGQEVEEWGKKVRNLRTIAEKLVDVFVGQEVGPDMKMLGERWEQIVKQVEERLKTNQAFQMVEVENIKTTISQFTISTPVPVIATELVNDEEIDTLPEEDNCLKKSRLSAELHVSSTEWKKPSDLAHVGDRESSLLSSRESSPDIEVVTGTMILQSNSPTLMSETVSKVPKFKSLPLSLSQEVPSPSSDKPASPTKTPPKTLPKPNWFSLDQHKHEVNEKTVSVSKSPPPVTNRTSGSSSKRVDAEEEEDEDAFLAKENFAIERILNEATTELAEVQRKSSYYKNKNQANNHQKDIREFEESASVMLSKIDKAKKMLNQLDQEQDLKLRRDFIGMEARMIEAEVATLISRGDTLVLFTHRDDVIKGESLQNKVSKLRVAWQDLKQLAEDKATSTQKSEEEILQFRKDVSELKTWHEDAARKAQKKSTDMTRLADEVAAKKIVLDRLNNQALAWPKKEALGTQGVVLAMLTSQWEDLQRRVQKFSKEASLTTESTTVDNALANKNAAEILSRIAKMREAVSAIQRQMRTQVLANKVYENLQEQSQALETVRQALEKLRPTIKRTAKDLEELTGSLSVEYLEKIVALSEKLRDEWQQVNHNYSERQALWNVSQEKHGNYHKKRQELDNWLERAERILIKQQSITHEKNAVASQEQLQIERQVAEKNKEVTELALLGKEIMQRTSAQENLEIQTQVDKILKRFKFVLSQLASQREMLNKEKYHNNVNYMNRWINDNLSKINAPVNPSDVTELTEAIEMLKAYHDPLIEKEKQMEKLSSSNTAIAADVIHKLRSKYEQLVNAIPKRISELELRVEKINGLSSALITISIWLNQMETQLEEAQQNPDKKKLAQVKKLIHEKENEVNELENSYQAMLHEVQTNKLTINKDLEAKVFDFRSQWVGLCSDCRQSLSRQQLKQSAVVRSKDARYDQELLLRLNAKTDSSCNGARAPEFRAPEIHAALRDHRDWIHRKRGQLASLTLAGDVASVQRQADEHAELRKDLEEQRLPISDDIRLGKDIENNEEIRSCLVRLEAEWTELCDNAEVWQNKVDNTLANMRIFEKGMKTLNSKLSSAEDAHELWSNNLSRRLQGHDDQEHLQRLAVQVSSLEQNMSELREQANRLSSLSPATLIQLDKVETRLISLKEDIQNQQRRNLSTPERGQHHEVNEKFNNALPAGWERGTTGESIPYYLNHADESTQWDHPVYTELMATLLEMNTVKYSAYRLALKLRKIQQKLCLDLLDLEVAIAGFDGHGLTSLRHDMAIQVPEMILVLTSIFEALQQEEPDEVDVALCVDLCLNWLLNVFDSARNGQVRVLSFKVGILVLCRGPLTEKYLQMFKLVATDKRLAPRQLGLLLFDAIQVPKVLGEVASFGGSNIEPSVRSCFSLGVKGVEPPLKDVDAKHFLKWLRQEPQSLVWLPVLHRLASAEAAKHNTKCKVCKMYPIVGFRYHCLKCFNFDLCHNCFFVGKTSKGHKPEHPMQEYCTSTGTSVNLKNLGQAVRNSFRTKKYFKKKQQKLGYLPVNSVLEGDDFVSSPALTLSPNLSLESRDLQGSHSGSLQPRLVHAESEGITELSQQQHNNSDDEHLLIARYCRELVDINDSDAPHQQKEDLMRMILDLEEKNKQLTREYDDLCEQKKLGLREAQGEDVLKKEAKELKLHSTRLEARMKILEDHNEKLLEQLQRLRQLLAEENSGDQTGNRNFGTLQSRAVVASELHSVEPGLNGACERRQPPSPQHFTNASANLGEQIVKLVSSFNEDNDSLDLSDHETQRVSD